MGRESFAQPFRNKFVTNDERVGFIVWMRRIFNTFMWIQWIHSEVTELPEDVTTRSGLTKLTECGFGGLTIKLSVSQRSNEYAIHKHDIPFGSLSLGRKVNSNVQRAHLAAAGNQDCLGWNTWKIISFCSASGESQTSSKEFTALFVCIELKWQPFQRSCGIKFRLSTLRQTGIYVEQRERERAKHSKC